MPNNLIPSDEVIASRELHVTDSAEKVLVQIGKPQAYEVDAKCPYRVRFRDYVFGLDVFGVDEFQALQLAMKTLPIELRHNTGLPIGKMYQFEPGDDMGFPEPKES